MITIIIYVSPTGEMRDTDRFFLQREVEQKKVYILEYRAEDLFIPILNDMEDIASRYAEWKLLLADDRNCADCVNDIYEKNNLLIRLTNLIVEKIKSKNFAASIPMSIYVVSSVGKQYFTAMMQKAKDLWEIKSLPAYIRFFTYYSGEENFLPDRWRGIAYMMILLFLVLDNSLIRYCRPRKIYRIDVEWEWKGVVHFLMQMDAQYEQMLNDYREACQDTSEIQLPTVYADTFSTPKVADNKWIGTTNWKKNIAKIKKVLEDLEKQLSTEASRSFKKIRQIYWRYDNRNWNVQEINSQMKRYQDELLQLYEGGILNFEEAREKIKTIEDRYLYNYSSMERWLRVIFQGATTLWIYGNVQKVDSNILRIIGFLCFFIFICFTMGKRWDISLRKQRYLIYETQQIEKAMEACRRNINKEFALMVDYRDNYHWYCEWKDERQKREISNREILYNLNRIRELRKWLPEGMVGVEGKPEMLVHRMKMKDLSEYFYYPLGWSDKKNLIIPGEEVISFPFPFISQIKVQINRDEEK